MLSSSKSSELEIKWVSECKGVVLATTKTNKQKNPSALVHKTVMKKEFSRMAKDVANQRRDLKSAALARLSSLHRNLKVAKSGAKKRNMQTSKKSSRVADKFYRRELKSAALARLSAVHRSLKVANVKNQNGGSLVVCETPRAAAQRRRKALNFSFPLENDNNASLVKELGNGNQMVQLSKEPNNLYNNVNSFKNSAKKSDI
ncbi:hypothetical protein C5167_018329 [Papaver somniferum]|uniref:Ribosomal eL28/Mak16 domain-containing protein n=1 Tax=Papaver somniferum TaxID=3469 RepID=A0A4Y7IR19_PAPSO|nr:hypothetical protein C5167_018329 [Papaver somniferum]